MAANRWFWNMIAKRYSRQAVGDPDAYQKKLDVTREYLTPDANVFEFGCGTGTTALYHAPAAGRILAVDFSDKMIAIAKAKAHDQGVDNVRFEQADILDMDLSMDSFDMVMGHSILHLLKDYRAVCARVADILKPGGVFVTSTICMGQANAALRGVLKTGSAIGLLPPVQFFSRADLEGAMSDAGLTIDHAWQPDGGDVVFLVAKKPDQKPSSI